MFSRSRKKIILSIMLSLILLFAVTLSVIMLASYREIRQRNAEMLERYVELYSLDQQSDSDGAPGASAQTSDAPEAGSQAPGAPGTGPQASDSPRTAPEAPPDERQGSGPSSGPAPDGPGDPGSKPDQRDLPPEARPDYELSTFYSVAFAEDGTVLSVSDGAKGLYGEDELIEISKELLSGGSASGRLGDLSYMVSSKSEYTLVAFIDATVTENSMRMLLRNVLIVGGAAIVVLFFISLFLSRRIVQPLEESDRQQKQFISDASHELKTPVAVINANAELLQRELGESEWLANIRYENERMGELVKQLLDLSRAENTDVPMEQLDFSRIVTGEVLAFESLAFEQGKTIISETEEGIHINGNQAQLKQLVSILLDNAVRHSSGSDIEISLSRQAHSAVLSVINEGEAIPKDQMAHLFDRFYRVDEARTSDGHHYGLGLSIAKAVTEKHGGSIEAFCEDGKVRFTSSFPIKN